MSLVQILVNPFLVDGVLSAVPGQRVHVSGGLLELLQGLVTVVYEYILVIDMVAGQQQANWSGKGKSAVTSVSGQSLKAVVCRNFRWQVFYVLKDIARYVLSYSKPLELLFKDLALPGCQPLRSRAPHVPI